MAFNPAELASQRSAETNQPREDWLKALENARATLDFAHLNLPGLARIAEASRSPEIFSHLTRLIYQHARSHANAGDAAELVLKFANDSPFSLGQWVDAIAYFYDWLLEHERKVDFLSMLHYLQCCVDAPDAQEGGQTLKALCTDMLADHGYDG